MQEDDHDSFINKVNSHRLVKINEPQDETHCKNEISTAKYTFITFFPKFLLEQFRRYANVFFLIIALLQQIPGVSPTGRYTTLVPLLIILAVSALKEIIEDYKRHRADDATNNSKTLVLRDNEWVQVRWKEVEVGDLLKVCNHQGIPADLYLLSSSEPQAMCYIETSNLDGETNLKLRQGLLQTSELLTADALSYLRGSVRCELPNRKLEEFVGVFYTKDGIGYPLKPNQLLLRGSTLKNTKWIFGLVIYTGKESKVMLNSTALPLKRSSVECQTNTYILYLFGVLFFLTVFTFAANLIWTRLKQKGIWYLNEGGTNMLTISYIVNIFLTSFIAYHTIVPISLQVSLEVVRFIQALFINWDTEMYDPDSDIPAMARTSNLNEELGQVSYLFSDKTGTLTRNVMEFKRCSIEGMIYGADSEDSNAMDDPKLLGKLQAGDPAVGNFFTVLAVCHTVVPDAHVECPDQPLSYQSSSPDEAALVKAARSMGYVFTTRTPTGVTVRVPSGQEIHYDVLQVLEFTSYRKRMGVVVRDPNGRILVMVKGADTVIYERLSDENRSREATMEHLSLFANTGLRTLCISWAEVDAEFYRDWVDQFYIASTALDNREAKLEKVAEMIERDLQLLGATAIEDKLQVGVPETIEKLARAGISIWLLTGDKQETAVNIGHSCGLLSPALQLFTMSTESLDETRLELAKLLEVFGDLQKGDNDAALVIDGRSLEFALLHECSDDFVNIALSCKSVICCRVSPWQKAQLVKLVRANQKNKVTMAIGDGANDVGMIQAAHVGVGISGMEGLQAACASDYAIGQFRFLQRLLLVHGAWNFNRLTKLILYSFYKNICLYLIQFWFAMLSGFSGQIIFERWTIGMYNVLFTAAPPMALGLFDRHFSSRECLDHPELYKLTQASSSFTVTVFLSWIINSVYHSALLFWVPLTLFQTDTVYGNGHTSSLLVLGNSVYTYVVITVCLKAGLEHTAWTWLSHLAIWGSVATWFIFLVVYSRFYPTLPIAPDMTGMDRAVYGCAIFWFGLIVIPPLCLTRDVVWKVIKRAAFGTIEDRVHMVDEMKDDPNRLVGVTIKSQLSDRMTFVRSLRRPDESERLLRLGPGAGVDQLSATYIPSGRALTADHGFAFSQEEHGDITQSDLIRRYDSTRRKPEGR